MDLQQSEGLSEFRQKAAIEMNDRIKQMLSMPVQPSPATNGNAAIADLVAQDIERRKNFGMTKYGAVLQANNGRDALQDAYEEVLDLACYMRQMIEERK